MALPCILCGDEASGLLCYTCREAYSRDHTWRGNAKACEKHQVLHFYDVECPVCKAEKVTDSLRARLTS